MPMTANKEPIKCGVLYREMELETRAIDPDKRTVNLSFSSTTPVRRFFGNEILDHNARSVDLTRLRNGGPLLVGHNPDDQIGVVEHAEVDGQRGRAVVRFGKSARAQEIFTDVQDGIRKQVSVGYRVNKMEEIDEVEGLETFRVVDWTPLEVSVVSIAADPSVGVGRAANTENDVVIMTRQAKETIMAEGETASSAIFLTLG